jgi:very-short-patch-repair endonuclease
MGPLDRLLAASPRGAAKLRALLRSYADGPRQKSDLERMLRRICTANGLPLPKCNSLLHGHEADFHWPDHKLIVEVDSWLYHRTRHAFNRDRRRDVELLADRRYRTARFTDLQLVHEPRWVAQTLAKLLSAS